MDPSIQWAVTGGEIYLREQLRQLVTGKSFRPHLKPNERKCWRVTRKSLLLPAQVRGKFEGRPFRTAINSLGAGGVKSKARIPGYRDFRPAGIIMRFGVFSFSFSFSLSFQRREPATVRIKESRPVPSLSSFAISRPSSDTSSVDFHFPDGSLLIPGAGHPSTTGKKRSSFYHTTLRGDKQTRFHDCGIRRFDLRRPSRTVNPRSSGSAPLLQIEKCLMGI